jgi:hypothetical protein
VLGVKYLSNYCCVATVVILSVVSNVRVGSMN